MTTAIAMHNHTVVRQYLIKQNSPELMEFFNQLVQADDEHFIKLLDSIYHALINLVERVFNQQFEYEPKDSDLWFRCDVDVIIAIGMRDFIYHANPLRHLFRIVARPYVLWVLQFLSGVSIKGDYARQNEFYRAVLLVALYRGPTPKEHP